MVRAIKNTPSLSNYLTPKIDGIHKVLAESTERQNGKTRQKAGFSGVPEILKAFSGTLYGAAPGVESISNKLKKMKIFVMCALYYLYPYPNSKRFLRRQIAKARCLDHNSALFLMGHENKDFIKQRVKLKWFRSEFIRESISSGDVDGVLPSSYTA